MTFVSVYELVRPLIQPQYPWDYFDEDHEVAGAWPPRLSEASSRPSGPRW